RARRADDSPAAAAARGRALYRSQGCAACHGPEGRGDGPVAGTLSFPPTDFRRPEAYRRGAAAAAIRASIHDGVREGAAPAMPAFPGLAGRDLEDLAAYVASLQAPAALSARGAWIRLLPPVSRTTAAYLTVANASDRPRVLESISTPAARSVELHRMTTADGMMEMREVAEVPVPANGSVSLAPGGYHAMLIGLKRPLTRGELVPLLLRFDDGTSLRVSAVVGDAAPEAP
ncbi:MAG: copper chaperone PCu(A)C, partial [Elusimicrobia bacterium]|nr:copper chaperone PCu(A)C [Elusimicrobiota bacterium]